MGKESSQPVKSFSSATRNILAGAALLLPSLTLLPFGGLYLWEHGLLVWWAAGSLVTVSLITFSLRSLLKPARRVQPTPAVSVEPGGDPHWSDEETQAWKAVLEIAARVDVDHMNSADYFADLGRKTLNTVALRLHPEKTDALWRFTLPEALAIVERVSRRLGNFVADTVPLGDTLTVAQLLAAYRWRGAMDLAERAYDVWRIIRIVNPATAVTNEARERLSRAVYNYGKEHISRRIAEAYVEEVGRAAIDLYGGRLMIAQRLSGEPAAGDDDPLRELASRHVSINVAVAGSTRSDRLALASMLGEAADRRRISVRTAAEGTLTTIAEPLALRAESTDGAAAAAAELQDADTVIWIISPAFREQDVRTLAAFSARAKARGQSVMPVMIPVALHDTDEEAKRYAGEVDDAAKDLAAALDTRATPAIVIVGLDVQPAASIEPLTGVIAERMALARRIHILRVLEAAKKSSNWSRSARQVVKAAGALTRAVVRRRQD